MKKEKIAQSYNERWLEIERPQPLSDNKIESLINDVISGKLNKDISATIYNEFKIKIEQWITSSMFNNLIGLENFKRKDIIIGCTQFIDALYMKDSVQVIKGDYRYHERLGNTYTEPGSLEPFVPLIIAMPFPSSGRIHCKMQDILDECIEKNIPVHIDGAWITCCKNVTFNFNHPSVKSVAVSLSKGLGLGWNRIGVRWSKETITDSISLMNDFDMNNKALVMIGLHFMKHLRSDHLWSEHGERYFKVCTDFNLEPTNSIHLALRDGHPVGISPLIRYLENAKS